MCGPSQRRCIVSRSSGKKADLIRFVVDPFGRVVPDLRERLPGRGCWVEARSRILDVAVRRRSVFERAFGRPVKVDDDLSEQVHQQLFRASLDSLCLSRKAGVLILGSTCVMNSARHQVLSCVLHASDGSLDGLSKLRAALTAGGQVDRVALVRVFTSVELGQALGLLNVIHAALPQVGAAFAKKIMRFVDFGDRNGFLSGQGDEGSAKAPM
ncbi:MAG: RNA-binding protein [Alphaproteobacteria bacterium]|nr:RNA-binding protein [Alphaproteobacteria bacterium]